MDSCRMLVNLSLVSHEIPNILAHEEGEEEEADMNLHQLRPTSRGRAGRKRSSL